MNRNAVIIGLLCGMAIIGIWAFSTVRPGYAADAHGHGYEQDGAEAEHAHEEGDEEHDYGGGSHEEGAIKLSAEQIRAAGIQTFRVQVGSLAREVVVPGRITAAADHMAQVVPKVGGTVKEARKNLGDSVTQGEILAVIESREMAETAADYLAARRAEELARTMYEREKKLWEKKITAEQDYLNARNAHQEAGIRLDLTRQKLQALGHDAESLKSFESGSAGDNLRFHEIRSPLSGRIIERELTLGEYVDTTHSAFTVADLDIVWVEIAIPPADLPFVKEGQSATVTGGGKGEGRLIFVSPSINQDTRAAKAIIALDNKAGVWHSGGFATAAIATDSLGATMVVPKESLQSVEGKSVVFVRVPDGFEKRVVSTGREDSRNIEITDGLSEGDEIAVTSSFTLKAELGKSEAGHEH